MSTINRNIGSCRVNTIHRRRYYYPFSNKKQLQESGVLPQEGTLKAINVSLYIVKLSFNNSMYIRTKVKARKMS